MKPRGRVQRGRRPAPRREARPQGSSATRDREARPQGSSATRDREARPQGSSAARDREARPQGSSATRNRDAEVKVCGRHACRALFERRAARILRVYLAQELVKPFGDLLHACAELRRPYKIVDASELERITESRHHEGICVVAAAEPPRSLADVLAPPGPGWLVALAGVENPHNTGAILRTAAHFGARAVLIEGAPKRLPPVVYRTAQGGAEWVDVVATPALPAALAEARRAGFAICATSSHGGRPLFAAELPPRVVVVLGAEDVGLPPALARAADLTVEIPGSGHVESLNVSAAAAVVLAELWRRRAAP
jgi:TrmH RNA methyltransferase